MENHDSMDQNKKLNIILVEDDNILNLAMKSMLVKMGHQVVAVEQTGRKAIDRAKELQPDVMFVDIYLKDEIDGITVVEQLQDNVNISFVYLTGNTDPDHLERAKRLRYFEYLVKPVNREMVKRTLNMITGMAS